jgi:hypothetical protein
MPFMISPAGFVIDLSLIQRADGSVVPTPSVSQLLPGGSVQVTGVGDHLLSGRLSGRQGTLDVSLITGAPGSARAVAFLVNNAMTPTKYIGIALDASNRPFALLSVDGALTVYGQSTPSSAPLIAGTPLLCRLAFSSTGVIVGGFFAAFELGGDDNLQDWAVYPSTAWSSFMPTHLLLGVGNLGGLADFNGKLNTVQGSDLVVARSTSSTRESLNPVVSVVANSLVTAALTVTPP